MASATYPEDAKMPPPYSVHDGTNTGVPYQQQVPPTAYPPNYGSSPPPIPVYAHTATTIYPVVVQPFLARCPSALQCPRCHQQIITVVQYEAGAGTWLISLLICIFGGVFGCCLIPFCAPSCQDVVHTCPSCRACIGRRNVM